MLLFFVQKMMSNFFNVPLRIFQVFQRCLSSLQREQFLQDIDRERLFSNIQEVYQTNGIFWNEYLRHVVAEAKRTREPIRPSQLLDSFAKVNYLYLSLCIVEYQIVRLYTLHQSGQ